MYWMVNLGAVVGHSGVVNGENNRALRNSHQYYQPQMKYMKYTRKKWLCDKKGMAREVGTSDNSHSIVTKRS